MGVGRCFWPQNVDNYWVPGGVAPRYICWDSEREKGEHPLGDVSGELLYSGVRVALQPANNKGRTLFCEKDPKGTCLYNFGLMNAYDSYANSWILDRYEPCQAASSKTCPNFYAKRSQRSTRASPRKSSHKTQSDSPKMPLVCTSFLHMSQPSPHVGPKTSQNCTSMEYRTGSCRLQTAAPCDNYFLGAGGALSHGLECFPGFYTSSLSLGLCGVAESIFSLTPWWQGQQRPWRSTLSFGRKSCLTWGDKPLMCKMSTKKNRDMTSQT